LVTAGLHRPFLASSSRQEQGVGGRLFEMIAAEARDRQLDAIGVDVGILARPFFESHGFTLITSQEVKLGDAELRKCKMAKSLELFDMENA